MPVGEEDSLSTGNVTLSFKLKTSLGDSKNDAFAKTMATENAELQIRIYMFRSETQGPDESFVCVSPYSSASEDPFFSVTLPNSSVSYGLINSFQEDGSGETITHNCGINIETSGGYYYRFMAIGISKELSTSNDRTVIACEPGTRWTDVKVRNSYGQPNDNPAITLGDGTSMVSAGTGKDWSMGSVEEVFCGIAKFGDSPSSTDYFIFGDGGSLNLEIELHRCVAGIMLCVDNIPDSIKSDFSWESGMGKAVVSEDNTLSGKIVTKGDSYQIDRVDILAVGQNMAFNPLSAAISGEYSGVITHYATVEIDETEAVNGNNGTKATNYYCNYDFAYPVLLTDKSTEGDGLILNRSSLYLALYTKFPVNESVNGSESNMAAVNESENNFCYYPLKVIPIRHPVNTTGSSGDVSIKQDDDGWVSQDRYRFNLQANHLYCLGTPDAPVDLSKLIRDENAEIEVSGNYQAEVNIPF